MNTQAVATVPTTKTSVADLAAVYRFADVAAFAETVKQTAFPGGKATVEQLAAFCAVAKEHGLSPFNKTIYAFPTKSGGIMPMVSVDGWLSMANAHPQMNGLETHEHFVDGKIAAVTCVIFRKDRSRPIKATEYLTECYRNTDPWNKQPIRMLTNRAMCQAIRRAFSFSGIVEPDEGEQIIEIEQSRVTEEERPAGLAGITAQLQAKKESRKTAPAPEPEPAPDEDPDADLFRDMTGSKVDPG